LPILAGYRYSVLINYRSICIDANMPPRHAAKMAECYSQLSDSQPVLVSFTVSATQNFIAKNASRHTQHQSYMLLSAARLIDDTTHHF
jgi:hypothetical protein